MTRLHVTEIPEHGEFRVHATGCRNITRDLRRGYEDGGRFASLEDAAWLNFTNQIEEETGGEIYATEDEAVAGYVAELRVLPCAARVLNTTTTERE